MITIHVNEVPVEIDENSNIQQLLEKINSKIDGIAVAINNTIISKNNWQSQLFSSNDNVLIIRATQGG